MVQLFYLVPYLTIILLVYYLVPYLTIIVLVY